MLSFVTVAISLLAGSAIAAPSVVKRAEIDDTTILQYALTLEHLENAFYAGALKQFDAAAFAKAGYPAWVRGRFEQIAAHETSHVEFLSTALGETATKACEYKFPYTDPKSFAALSMALEAVGTSAYLGAAQFIKNPAYLTVAGSILTTEARHNAWVSSAVSKKAAWNLPYDTPLGLSGVYSLASQFITSCPETNPALPVSTFPALTLGATTPGASTSVSFTNMDKAAPLYVAYYSGLNVVYSKIEDGKTTVPQSLEHAGQVYASVVNSNTGTPTDATTLTGLAILNFSFTSSVKL